MRRKFSWTPKQVDKLNIVKNILEELEEYKPLTLRQIYYQMVGKGFIENNKSQYRMLSTFIKWARIKGEIDWDDIEDRGRVYHDLTGWDDSDDFIRHEQRYFLEGYKRNLLQTQDKYIEIWVEKDAVSSIFTNIADYYTISVVACKGFSSVSFLNDFKERLRYHGGKEAVMLYFGDFDPSGVIMSTVMKTTLEEELGVSDLRIKMVALSKEDIVKYKLPHNPDALKKTDPRAQKHMETFGELAVELDALSIDVLEKKIKLAIEDELDMDKFNNERLVYEEELDKLNNLRDRMDKYVKRWIRN